VSDDHSRGSCLFLKRLLSRRRLIVRCLRLCWGMVFLLIGLRVGCLKRFLVLGGFVGCWWGG